MVAAAQATFTAQERRVEATSRSETHLWEQGTNPGPPDFDPPTASFTGDHSDATAAPDFGGFSASATSTAPPAVGTPAPAGSSTASQTSSLAASSITASGTFSAVGDSEFLDAAAVAALNALLQPPIPYVGGVLQGRETATTSFSVDFQINAPTLYHLAGNVAHTPGTIGMVPPPIPAAGTASIDLTGPSGNVASVSLTPLGGSQDLDASGVLRPGAYQLRATGTGVTNATCRIVIPCMDPTMSGSFELSLSLGAAVVPGPSRGLAALLELVLMATGAAALRRA